MCIWRELGGGGGYWASLASLNAVCEGQKSSSSQESYHLGESICQPLCSVCHAFIYLLRIVPASSPSGPRAACLVGVHVSSLIAYSRGLTGKQ